MPREQENITETIVQIAVEVARGAVQAMLLPVQKTIIGHRMWESN